MLDQFKKYGNLANQTSQSSEQIKYLRKFITTEINKVVEKSRQDKPFPNVDTSNLPPFPDHSDSSKAILPSLAN